MKALRFSIFFTLFLISTLYLPNTFAQDYTQWHLPDGAKARFGNGRPTEGIAFSPDGTRLAVGSKLGIWIYDSRTYKELALLIGHSGNITTIAFSPDSTRLASGSWDNTIRLWDVTTGQHLKTLEGHKWSLYSIAFSPDGQTLVSGGGDGTIRLWDVATGKHLKTLTGHQLHVTSVAFSPDGQTLASGSWDDTVRLWDVSTHEHIKTFIGHRGNVTSVALSRWTNDSKWKSGQKRHPVEPYYWQTHTNPRSTCDNCCKYSLQSRWSDVQVVEVGKL